MSDGPKSALELAMERLRQQDADAGVSAKSLSEEQKQEIAEIRKTYTARLAQEEILYKSKRAASVDFEERQKFEENYRRDVERLSRERDRKIEHVRQAEG